VNYYFEGVFNYEIPRHFYFGGTWKNIWPIFVDAAPPILIRNGIRGFFLVFEILALVAIFYRFCNKPSKFGKSLTASAYGIYLLHEPIVVWMHVYLSGQSIPTLIKFVLSAGVGIGASWFIVDRVLLKLPGFRRVL